MKTVARSLVVIVVAFLCGGPAFADDEAGNGAQVTAGPYGRCYAKSVPEHIYDPEGEPRQQGRTLVYRVTAEEDLLVHTYDWFAQQLFVLCGAGEDIVLVRLGPWHRGHDPQANHLALAFYRAGALQASYSTLDIAGDERTDWTGLSAYANVVPSVSHYTVFARPPEMVRVMEGDGPIFRETYFIEAQSIDGRELRFEMHSGELQP